MSKENNEIELGVTEKRKERKERRGMIRNVEGGREGTARRKVREEGKE